MTTNPIYSVEIAPDGTITESRHLAADANGFDYPSVLTAGIPFFAGGHGIHVMFIDDFGAADAPLNRKAWAVYGRSPVWGTAFLSRDDGAVLDPEQVAVLRRPIAEWPIPQYAIEHLTTASPERPAMLHERPE